MEDPVAVRRLDPNATIVNASGMHLLVLEQTQVESVSRDGAEHLYTNRLVIPMVSSQISTISSAAVINQKYLSGDKGARRPIHLRRHQHARSYRLQSRSVECRRR